MIYTPHETSGAEKLIAYGMRLQSQGKTLEAYYCFKHSLILNPNNAIALNSLGTTLYALGNKYGAIDAYKKAVLKDKKYALPAFNVAVLYQLTNDITNAVKYFRHTIRIRPRHLESYIRLAHCLTRLGKCTQAITAYKEAVQLHPKDISLMQEIASLSAQVFRYSDAENYFKKALLLAPVDAHIMGNLALVYKQQNKNVLAKETLIKAIRLNPTLPHLYYTLGVIYRELGDTKKSTENIDTAYALDPSLKEEYG
ncbi:hypothetical protein A3D80_02990 [Candidatus Roizmanbacteria bacterium RIFCSPHIGHO2_02_FULL_40_13b]|uniref:Uncharacterized protein n=1 Tax=Candidatus Roizmanbacteria bacterium RIFCSPHIGHO2_01_FULL_39_24 TaxID=1802032 RepID=A0A1F7GII0_9BACT|nr:MAG: hypothetical protein A2799_02050 [Candidatus Roizmanbacteria bacterium RIFCSPHIGHO2_01_FULL_39_24]OGK27158.1 MAG: hypothetical protein A3D80_02990 [Candidatus Roizmanbacteria bacterium RIFCSPHIGHO2_02_FULL_40_13b]OGK49446.1 MAG: hypothetical protein A3A56_00125 [Candidatus Roizmanbacteria bacterium RIFCSPLOWO2_01_FULL_40_32]OGK57359.1 MAG: hypothetical protein A3H83_00790 [Candidatus Roizmanbacteria bacterium RIFCSPLOWO2_02_FULL_39_8]